MKGYLIRMSLCSTFLFSIGAMARPVPDKALLVLLGGYNSCNKTTRTDMPPVGIKMQPFFQKVLKAVHAGFPKLEVMTLAGCLDTDAPPDGEGMYVSSDEPKSLKYGHTKDVRQKIEDLMKANPAMPVFLIGHSYGAWMSMFLAESLAGKNELRGLYTIDAIGPECGAFGVVFGDSACHSAPTDRDNKAIKKRVEAWVNFFQDEDSWLSSSQIPEAENHQTTFGWGPHGDVALDATVWKRIEVGILASLTK